MNPTATGPSDPPVPGSGPARPTLKVVAPGAEPDSADDMDAWMVAVAQHQDRQAFARLFEHYAPRLKTWLMRTGSEAEFADDLVQDSFVLLWRKAAQFDPARARVAAWLFTIARNLRVDRKRGLSEAWISLEVAQADLLADPTPGIDTRLARAHSDASVRHALRALTSDQRTLIQLSFYDDKSHSSIASELRLPLGTVKTRLRAAATRLRQLLEQERP